MLQTIPHNLLPKYIFPSQMLNVIIYWFLRFLQKENHKRLSYYPSDINNIHILHTLNNLKKIRKNNINSYLKMEIWEEKNGMKEKIIYGGTDSKIVKDGNCIINCSVQIIMW